MNNDRVDLLRTVVDMIDPDRPFQTGSAVMERIRISGIIPNMHSGISVEELLSNNLKKTEWYLGQFLYLLQRGSLNQFKILHRAATVWLRLLDQKGDKLERLPYKDAKYALIVTEDSILQEVVYNGQMFRTRYTESEGFTHSKSPDLICNELKEVLKGVDPVLIMKTLRKVEKSEPGGMYQPQ